MRHREAASPKRLLDKPNQRHVVIDIEDSDGFAQGKSRSFRNLDYRKEQPELPDRVGKALVVDWLRDVDVSAEVVAALDLSAIVRRRQHDHRRTLEMRIRLDLAEQVDAGHVRQV